MDAATIAHRFALGSAAALSAEPVARGKQGLVWQLETSDGLWAVKMTHRPLTAAVVESATAFQEAAYAAGVPTPQVRRTTEGDVLARIGGAQVRIYEWVDLLPPDPSLDPQVVGTVLATIHSVQAPPVGSLDAWYREPLGKARWDEIIDRLRQGGAPFVDRLAALRDELVALESWIEPPEVLQTCHRDLWADNFLPTAAGGVCVIDWDNSGLADPSHELGCVLFEFARTDPGRARTLAAAYRAAGGTARTDRPGQFTMLITQLGHITEAAALDWLEPNPRSPDRDAASAWIGEVLDEPHTRELLHILLEAARDGQAVSPTMPPTAPA